MVVFPDFDGVFHPQPCFREEQLFCWLPRFESVMREFPKIDIVISSSWRREESLDQLRGHFSQDIGLRVIGTTPLWNELSCATEQEWLYPRETEIRAWMRREREPWEPWVAVDDRGYWFRPFSQNVVICDPETGFDKRAEATLAAKLRSGGRA